MRETAPRAPFKVRASSWGALFDCAHRWEGTHILGLRSPSGLRSVLGTAIHASTALFDLSRVNHTGLTAMETADAFIDALHHPRDEIDYRNEDITVAEAERIGLILHARYCAEISPRYDYVAVEMETKPLIIDCGHGVEIQLTGTMDRARAIATEHGARIADLKTGKTAVTTSEDGKRRVAKTKGHKPQIGTYEMLYEHTTGDVINGPGEIIGLHTGKPEVAVGEIHDARRLLIGTDESPGLIEYATEMFRSGLFPPNPQSTLCGKKYCARWNQCVHHD